LVAEETIAALRSFRQSGRKLILVTGRELPDLRRVFPHLDLFGAAAVENGAGAGGSKRRSNAAIPTPRNERARHRYY
jgi:hydroxymethylpyrimidine pyrophosphatase-like HAD family hydrolase